MHLSIFLKKKPIAHHRSFIVVYALKKLACNSITATCLQKKQRTTPDSATVITSRAFLKNIIVLDPQDTEKISRTEAVNLYKSPKNYFEICWFRKANCQSIFNLENSAENEKRVIVSIKNLNSLLYSFKFKQSLYPAHNLCLNFRLVSPNQKLKDQFS